MPQLEYVTQQNNIMYTDQVILIQLIDMCSALDLTAQKTDQGQVSLPCFRACLSNTSVWENTVFALFWYIMNHSELFGVW